MNIGDKIGYVVNRVEITKITNIVPVKYCDDGADRWYEVVEPAKSNLVAIIGEDVMGNESIIIIRKESENLGLLLDLF